MKIVQVTQRFYPAVGGVENHVHNIAKRLVKRGHEVVVYTSDLLRDNPLIRLPDHAEREVDEIKIRRFKAFQVFPNIDASVVMFSMVTALLKSKADVVHAHNYCYFPAYSTALTRRATRMPLVLTTHTGPESMAPRLRKFYDFAVGRYILRTVDHIISLTRRNAEYLISVAARPEKISIIPNGIDIESFSRHANGLSFREKYCLDGRVILFVGRLSKQKGLEYLLEAMQKILEQVPDAVLVLVGQDFGAKAELKAQVKQLGVENNVLFTGFLSGDELLNAYDASDIFVLPSVVEPFGIVLLEAMAAGKPVVATNVSIASDLIRDGVNGFLVEPRNPYQIAKAAITLLQDRRLTDRIRSLNRAIAAEYSWDRIAQKVEGVYRRVLGD